MADIDASVKELQALPAVKGDRIAIMGHCMGGRMAYLGAASNAAFKAAVVLYGGGIFRAEGEGRLPPIALTPNIKCAIAGFFGRDDKNPPPDDVERISQELKKHSIRHDFRIYDGAGHAFQNFTSQASYREAIVGGCVAAARPVPQDGTEVARGRNRCASSRSKNIS